MTNDGQEELRHRIRSEEAPPAAASVVIRGGPDTPSLLRTHARRLQRLYVLDGEPVLGISVFVALDDVGPASERGLLVGRLQSYPSVYRSTVGRLIEAGFTLLPTFKRPHFTVIVPSLASLDDFATALGPLIDNPYAGR